MPTLRAALLSPTWLLMARAIFRHMRHDLSVIKSFRAFAHDAATDEAFERAQFAVIFGRYKTDGVTHGVRATGAADAMDVIFDVHGEIIIHHV